jgi:hypothetical protein
MCCERFATPSSLGRLMRDDVAHAGLAQNKARADLKACRQPSSDEIR